MRLHEATTDTATAVLNGENHENGSADEQKHFAASSLLKSLLLQDEKPSADEVIPDEKQALALAQSQDPVADPASDRRDLDTQSAFCPADVLAVLLNGDEGLEDASSGASGKAAHAAKHSTLSALRDHPQEMPRMVPKHFYKHQPGSHKISPRKDSPSLGLMGKSRGQAGTAAESSRNGFPRTDGHNGLKTSAFGPGIPVDELLDHLMLSSQLQGHEDKKDKSTTQLMHSQHSAQMVLDTVVPVIRKKVYTLQTLNRKCIACCAGETRLVWLVA